MTRNLKSGLGEIYRGFSIPATVKEMQKFVPMLRSADVVRGPSGVRAQAIDQNGNLVDDFVFDSGILFNLILIFIRKTFFSIVLWNKRCGKNWRQNVACSQCTVAGSDLVARDCEHNFGRGFKTLQTNQHQVASIIDDDDDAFYIFKSIYTSIRSSIQYQHNRTSIKFY